MRKLVIAVLAVLLAHTPASAQNPRGTLIIIGGGPRSEQVAQRFFDLAGGTKGKILVFPMASGNAAAAGISSVGAWTPMGIQAISAVMTHEQAMNTDTAVLFRGVTGIYFPGGDQSRLTAALNGTPVLAAIRNHYRNGAVVGGTSAGAAVMSQMMITGDERKVGGFKRPTTDSTLSFISIDRDNVITTEGFGLISNAIIDQHFVRRKRHNRLISLVLSNPTLVGAGIDESTAIEVQPDGLWRVWGESVVVIYDARKSQPTKEPLPLGARDITMHVLPSGSTFNLSEAKARLP